MEVREAALRETRIQAKAIEREAEHCRGGVHSFARCALESIPAAVITQAPVPIEFVVRDVLDVPVPVCVVVGIATGLDAGSSESLKAIQASANGSE